MTRVPQKHLCYVGFHAWSNWTVWRVPATKPPIEPIRTGPPIGPQPIEAYRYRYCECGVVQREDYRDRSILTIEATT